jgi:hypothetical protein
MELFRLHAYEVSPQRLSTTPIPPRGGAFSGDALFKKSLEDFVKKSKLASQPTVDFRVKPGTGSNPKPVHELRSLIIDYAFGTAARAKSTAVSLATRFGKSMDGRSPFTLLLLSAYRRDSSRRLIIWAFPKDEPFHFTARGDRAQIKILKDAFSRSSSFKKAALFEGTNHPSQFLCGHVIDRQSQNGHGTAADYWINTFLDSRSSLTGKAGTQLLAKCLRDAYNTIREQSDRDQIAQAIVGAHASRRRKWSLQGFAKEYLEGNASTAFLSGASPESRNATFDFNKHDFEQKLNFHIYRLEDDVVVSAPFGAIGKSVTIHGGAQRRLRCEGSIKSEKVRASHG